MGKSKGPKWYAVRSGRKPGVYATWSECEVQTKGFSGAVFKSFPTKIEAEQFVGDRKYDSAHALLKKQQPILSIGSKRNNSEVSVIYENEKLRGDGATCQNKKIRGNDNVLTITINFDGASRGNPGVAGAGTFLQVTCSGGGKEAEHHQVFKIRKYLGTRETNNVAEYHGLIQGLRQALCIIEDLISEQSSMTSIVNVTIRGDSNLIINQMKKIYKCKHTGLTPLYDECHGISSRIRDVCHRHGLQVEILYEHVFRDQNKEADSLANEAIDRQESWIEVIDDVNGNDGTLVSKSDSNGSRKRIQGHADGNKLEFVYVDV